MGELATEGPDGVAKRLSKGVIRALGWLCCKLSIHALERPHAWNTDRQYPYRLCRCSRCHGTD